MAKINNYSVEQAWQAFDACTEFFDIREAEEFAQSRIPGSVLLPLSEINRRLDDFPRDREIIIYCRTGHRSRYLIEILAEHGYTNLINLEGGIVEWYEAGYPVDTDPVG